MRFPAIIIVAILLFACRLPALAAPDYPLADALRAGRPRTIVAYGTSLTAWGAWVEQLQQALNARYPGLATVINGGEPGMWSQWGVENLEARVLRHRPDVVLIEFGINDAYPQHKTSVRQARRNLTTMIDRIRTANRQCRIILLTMNPTTEREPPPVAKYYGMYRAVAKQRKLPLIDLYPRWTALLTETPALFARYVPDAVHPGAEGCRQVITPAVLAALGIDPYSRLVANLRAGQAQKIVAYGTSLTRFGDWVEQLQQALNAAYPGLATVVNSGMGSMASPWGVENLDAFVLQQKPDAVLIEFAINDAYLEYNISIEQARKNLLNMIDRILQAYPRCQVALMTMNVAAYPGDRPQYVDYYQMYREVAAERKLPLIDHYASWKALADADPERFVRCVPDGLHPNAEGSRNVITPEILTALGVGAAATSAQK